MTDVGGSMGRRFVLFELLKTVQRVNTTFERQASKETGLLIKKCNAAYHHALALVGDKSLDEVLPKYFERTKESLQNGTNILDEFLMGEMVSKKIGYYVPMRTFIAEFNKFCENKNYAKPEFHQNYYKMPFAKHSLQVKIDALPYPRNSASKKRDRPMEFIYGVDVSFSIDSGTTQD